MGRPKSDEAKTEAVQVRLRPEQLAAFDRVVAGRAAKLKGQGVEVTRTTVLRSLVERAIQEEDPEAAEPSGEPRPAPRLPADRFERPTKGPRR